MSHPTRRPNPAHPARSAVPWSARRLWPLLLAPIAATFALVACDQAVAGKDDVLSFRYDVNDQLFPQALTTPVASSLLVDIEVFGKAGSNEPASVLDATSADPAIADVVATAGNVITVRAKVAGKVEITVRSSLGEDAFDLTVGTLSKVNLEPPGVLASDSPPSKALSGGTARFFAYLRDGSNRSLVGYGPLTITATPAGSATFPEATDIGMVPVRLTGEGQVTLQADNDDPLVVEVVPQTDLTGLEFKGLAIVATVKVDGTLVAVLRGATADGSSVVGVASVAATTSSNTALCTITPNPRLGEGAFDIVGKAVGTCRIQASLGALSKSYDIEVTAK